MDDAQAQHLKAYGVAWRVLDRGGRGEWLLNYRGGSFLLPDDPEIARLYLPVGNPETTFLYGVIGWPGTPWEDNRLELQKFWDGQMADAQAVLDAVRADPLPALVAGDFNAPHMGHIHDLITRELGDAHAEAGAGFGFSFPGTTRNPLSAGGPWMRIDYVFHSRHWQALNCTTEASRPSQHRAVAATLRLSAP